LVPDLNITVLSSGSTVAIQMVADLSCGPMDWAYVCWSQLKPNRKPLSPKSSKPIPPMAEEGKIWELISYWEFTPD
jgi:hypothetical protein